VSDSLNNLRKFSPSLDVISLGLLGFSDNYDKKKSQILDPVVKAIFHKYVETEKNVPVLGIPPRPAQATYL